MARTSMLHLIVKLRELTQTRVGTPFADLVTDDQLEEVLDQTRTTVNLFSLTPIERVAPGGAVTYHTFESPFGDWEDDLLFQSPNGWATLTPTVPSATSLLVGRWSFEANQPSGVLVTGTTYDRFLAAALVCEQLLASQELYTFNFSAGGESFQREAIRANYLSQAKTYRAQARPRIADLVRGDSPA